jgi:amidase
MTPLGLGGDYGGSLRIPASYCGISSLRPTPGRIPLATSLPGPAPTLTVQLFTSPGPLARSVRDLTLMYDGMLGGDPRDPGWTPAPDGADPALHPVAVTTSGADADVHPEVRDAVRRAADALADAGHPVVEVEPPLIGEVSDAYARLLVTEVMTLQHEGIRALGSADAITFIETLPELFAPLDLAGYASALAERLTLRRQWSAFLAQYPIVLGPVSAQLPWPVGHDLGGADNVRAIFSGHRLTVCANYLALPAVTVPAGRSASGLPIGVQLITAPFTERRALAAAGRVEARLGHHTPIDPRH